MRRAAVLDHGLHGARAVRTHELAHLAQEGLLRRRAPKGQRRDRNCQNYEWGKREDAIQR
jgi:hypothetical protein